MKRIICIAIAFIMALSIMPVGVIANTITDGNSSSVTVQTGSTRQNYLRTTTGSSLGGNSWHYTTNDNIQGGAFCVDWGKSNPSASKVLPLTGRYTANPKAVGAVANGYPQRPLSDFIAINSPTYSDLVDLTTDEYAYATQIAVWAALGQVGVEGTAFTAGRAIVAWPLTAQEYRVFAAVNAILMNAASWDRQYEIDLQVRISDSDNSPVLDIQNHGGLEGAANSNQQGIRIENRGGTDYYTRTFSVASWTSTYNNGYFIDVWLENAPAGSFLTDLSGNALASTTVSGRTAWRVPTTFRYTTMNGNGQEYSGDYKLWLPVSSTPLEGRVGMYASSTVNQFNIFMAYNDTDSEQSYVVADPLYKPMEASGIMQWNQYNNPTGENDEGDGRIILLKVDENGRLLTGVGFRLQGSDGSVRDGMTNGDGFFIWGGLDPDVTYTLTETNTPPGFLPMSPQHISVTAGETITLRVVNYSKSEVRIRKIDQQNGASLTGATFRIEQIDGSFVTTGTTQGDGYIVLDNTDMPLGAYKVTEITAPQGYELDPDPQTFNYDGRADVTLTFQNVRKPTIQIIKIDKDTHISLPGATFDVMKNGQKITTITTDDAGMAYVYDVSEGYYQFIETIAPVGYLVDPTPHEIYVNPYNPATSADPVLVIENSQKPTLTIKKIDSLTGDPILGAWFTIEFGKSSTTDGALSSVGRFQTDENGEIRLESLEDGWYKIVEVEPAPGYQLKEPMIEEVFLKKGENNVVTFENTPLSALIIRKIDSQTGEALMGAMFRVDYLAGTSGSGGTTIAEVETSIHGTYTLNLLKAGTYIITETQAPDGYLIDNTPKTVYISGYEQAVITVEFTNTKIGGAQIIKLDEETRQPLAGVEFEIRKMNGEIIDTYRTDARGIIALPEMEDGWYTVVETKAADGYQLDSEPRNIEIKKGKTTTLEITNRKMSGILLQKICSVTKKGIYGVTFLIMDELNNPVMQATTDQDGYIHIDKKLTDGVYKIREIQAAKGYIIDNQIKTFKVVYGGTSLITWENTPEMGQIQIIKKSADDNPMNGFPKGTLLEGAVFEIREHKTNNLIDTVKSDKNGLAVSKTVPLGRYVVKEITAPDFYKVNENVVDMEVEFAGQIVKVEVLNESVYTNVSIQKRGYGEAVPNQEISYTFDRIRNNSTVPLDSFYWRDTIPTDAVRLTKIVTGTYNQRLSYKVVYRTNLHDWRTLADNLETSRNYVLEANSSALGLASNEYVTDFMFVFGRVPAGFSNIEKPMMHCHTVSWLQNGYQFTNKVDVGGLHGEQWIMSDSKWTTRIYAPQVGTLPRTGY